MRYLNVFKLCPKVFIVTGFLGVFFSAGVHAEYLGHTVGISLGGIVNNLKGEQTTHYADQSVGERYETDRNLPINLVTGEVNLGLTYQARYSNFILAGTVNYYDPTYKGYLNTEAGYVDKGRLDIITNNVDAGFEFLYKLAGTETYGVYGGGSLAVGFMHIAHNSTDYVLINSSFNNQVYLIPRLSVYTDYNVGSRFLLFTKLSLSPTFIGAEDVLYQINPSHLTDKGKKAISNTVSVHSYSSVALDFGVLFKI